MWDLVSELLTDPERLRVGLDAMVEQERSGVRGDSDQEARVWLERLAEADRMRAGYQELAAKGLMTIEELSARLEELETTRRAASDELEAIRRRAERPPRNRTALLAGCTLTSTSPGPSSSRRNAAGCRPLGNRSA